MSLIFSVLQEPKNANSFSVSIFQDGTLIHRVFDDTISNKLLFKKANMCLMKQLLRNYLRW